MGTCSIAECTKPKYVRGWCTTHYQRWQRHGDPTVLIIHRSCSVDGCEIHHVARGLCSTHYRAWWRTQNPGYDLAGDRRRREGYRDRRRELERARYASDPERFRRKARAVQLQRNDRTPYDREEYDRALDARRAFYGGRCWICLDVADTMDHVIPRSKGGSNLPANLRPACRACNSRKKDKLIHRDLAAERLGF